MVPSLYEYSYFFTGYQSVNLLAFFNRARFLFSGIVPSLSDIPEGTSQISILVLCIVDVATAFFYLKCN